MSIEQIQQIAFSPAIEQDTCFHCGDACGNSNISSEGKRFCCNGCKMVYELLSSNEMCAYYDYSDNPGVSPAEAGNSTKYKYLEDESVRKKLVNFSDGNTASVTFYVPSMHCSSCVWLLENLVRLNPLVHSSRVNYLKKEVQITFEETGTSLRQLVELLSSLGYEPQINLDSLQKKEEQDTNRSLYIKIGIAGFSFGNIMLFRFPDYLAGGAVVEPYLNQLFNYLSVLLAIPVLIYSSQDYFKSARAAFRQKMVNMDVPISLGIITLFLRSLYEIFSNSGAGYLDSFTGLVLFLLIGKIFEKKTYDSLSFERDFKSYFPVSVTKKNDNRETTIPLEKLQLGDRIIIRNQELIPADAILIRGDAHIDYSFVTGESEPISKQSGDQIYAGGKQIGGILELDVIKEVNQSYLTELWNDETFSMNKHSRLTTAANIVSRYFTIIVITIALAAMIYWAGTSWDLALNALTAVLIIACPCALALSTPFTFGNTLRVFGWNKFYLKNTAVIEALAATDHIAFDKTGTITQASEADVRFKGEFPLTSTEKSGVFTLTRQSMHPLSQHLAKYFKDQSVSPIEDFVERSGEGIQARIGEHTLKLGSATFVECENVEIVRQKSSVVHFSIDGRYRGYFAIKNKYRSGLSKIVQHLKDQFELSLLTGDSDREQEYLKEIFKSRVDLHFDQSPFDKLNFVRKLQKDGNHVLMVGDGLNDAGALNQSDVGISLTENINSFSPASDAILDAENFWRLPDFITFSKKSMQIIMVSFAISFLYNIIGISFAVQGTLSPLIAAVLMPISSISVVVFTTLSVIVTAKRMNFTLYRESVDAV